MNLDAARRRELFYETLDDAIRESRTVAVGETSGKDKMPLRTGSKIDYYQVLGDCLDSEEAVEAFAKVLDDVMENLVHSIMVTLDNGGALADHYRVALIDRDSKEDLAPDRGDYHHEFISYRLDRED